VLNIWPSPEIFWFSDWLNRNRGFVLLHIYQKQHIDFSVFLRKDAKTEKCAKTPVTFGYLISSIILSST
jgi:hypothetical protein